MLLVRKDWLSRPEFGGDSSIGFIHKYRTVSCSRVVQSFVWYCFALFAVLTFAKVRIANKTEMTHSMYKSAEDPYTFLD